MTPLSAFVALAFVLGFALAFAFVPLAFVLVFAFLFDSAPVVRASPGACSHSVSGRTRRNEGKRGTPALVSSW